MKFIFTTAALLMSIVVIAKSDDVKVKAWKTLVHDNGYSFKYPGCWEVKPDDAEQMEEPVTKANDIVVESTEKCGEPLLNPPEQNYVAFTSGWTKTPSKEEVQKKLDQVEKFSKENILRKEWLYFKRFKIGRYDAYVDVNVHQKADYSWIDWEMKLYCPKYVIFFSGPAIREPGPSYLEKFKKGDLRMPEPEKTIFESIKCTEPKDKSSHKN